MGRKKAKANYRRIVLDRWQLPDCMHQGREEGVVGSELLI